MRAAFWMALERGTIELSAWTQIGIMAANWDRYLKFRIDPSFFFTNLVIVLNLKKWNSLSRKSREILTRVAIEHEQSSVKDFSDLRTRKYAELDKRGLKVVALPSDAAKRYVESARAASLARMKERMEKSGGRWLFAPHHDRPQLPLQTQTPLESRLPFGLKPHGTRLPFDRKAGRH